MDALPTSGTSMLTPLSEGQRAPRLKTFAARRASLMATSVQSAMAALTCAGQASNPILRDAGNRDLRELIQMRQTN